MLLPYALRTEYCVISCECVQSIGWIHKLLRNSYHLWLPLEISSRFSWKIYHCLCWLQERNGQEMSLSYTRSGLKHVCLVISLAGSTLQSSSRWMWEIHVDTAVRRAASRLTYFTSSILLWSIHHRERSTMWALRPFSWVYTHLKAA